MSSKRKEASFCDVPTLNIIVDYLKEQTNRGIYSTLLFPDWSSFKTTVNRSEHELKETDIDGFSWVFRPSELSIYFGIKQTLFVDHYKEGSPALGFGFKDFECLVCGHSDLLYDEEKEARYCPKHG